MSWIRYLLYVRSRVISFASFQAIFSGREPNMEGLVLGLKATHKRLILRSFVEVLIANLAVDRPENRSEIDCNRVNLHLNVFCIHGKTGPNWTPMLSLVIRSSSGVFHR
jgi:hypothetical protein